MLDLSHIPNSQQDIKVFYSNGITNAWQTWQKPRKCQWVWIMAIGGAAGGFGGGTSNNINGGPGGNGAVTRALFNASLLSDVLFIQVGLGGTSNSGGSKSYIALRPNVTAQNIVLTSGATAATVTTSETIATSNNMNFATLGNFISTPGPVFSNSDVSPLTSTITTMGTAGGFKDSVNGTVTSPKNMLATSISPFISGGISSTTTDGTDGNSGYTSWKPFFSLGGTGGGSSLVGVGGNGGNGGIGSGGGGGGSGQLAGGNGGRGGDGLVIIITF